MIKVLYLNGVDRSRDSATTAQLLEADPTVELSSVASPPDAFAALRASGDIDILVTSPAVARSETLALIVSLRRDRIPVAILPVVTETQQEFATAAIAAGADDVLLQLGGTLLNPSETLLSVMAESGRPRSESQPLRVLYAGPDDLVWSLLEQVPFVKASRAKLEAGADRPLTDPSSSDGSLQCDLVLIDVLPEAGLQAQAVKSVRTGASGVPMLALTPPGLPAEQVSELGLDPHQLITKTGLYRRPLVAALERLNADRTQPAASQNGHGTHHEESDEPVAAPEVVVVSAATAEWADVANLPPIESAPSQQAGPTAADIAEREAWDQERAQLAEQLAEARAALEEARSQQAREAEESQQIRQHLDAALDAARTELKDTAESRRKDQEAQKANAERVEALEAEARTIQEAHRIERERWEEQSDTVEGRLRSAAAAAARTEFQAIVDAGKAELRQALDAHQAERASWDSSRAELAERIAKLEGVEVALKNVETTRAAVAHELDEARRELKNAVSARQGDQAIWADEREQLMSTIEALQSSATDTGLLSEELTVARQALETEIARAAEEADRHAIDTATLADANHVLESQLAAAQQSLAAATSAHDAQRSTWKADWAAWEAERVKFDTKLGDAGRSARDAARVEVEALKAERDELRSELDGLRSARNTLQADVDEARTAATAAQADAAASQIVIDGLREELRQAAEATRMAADGAAAADTARQDMQGALDQARTDSDTARADAEAARTERIALQSQLDDLRAAGNTLQADVDEARTVATAAQADASAAQTVIEQLREELRQAGEASRAAADGARQDMQGALDQARADADTARTDAAAARTERAALQSQLDDLRAAGNTLQADVDEARTEATAAQADAASAQAVIEQLRDELRQAADATRAAVDSVAAADSARQELQGALDQARRDADVARTDSDTARTERHALQSELDGLRTAENTLQADVDAAQALVERLREELRQAADTAGIAADAARHDMQGALDHARSEREAVRTELDAVRAQLDVVRAAEEAIRAEANAAREDAQASRAEIEVVRNESSETRAQSEHLADQLSQTTEALAAAQTARTAERETWEREQESWTSERAGWEAGRAAWDDERYRLEARATEAATATEAVRRELDAARTHLDESHRWHESERAAWDAARTRLEADAAERERERASERDDLNAKLVEAGARVQAAADRHRRFVQDGLFGHAELTLDGRLLHCNDTFARIFGCANADDLLARPLTTFTPLTGRAVLDAEMTAVGHAHRVESCVDRLDGEPVRILESAAIVADPNGDIIERLLIDLSEVSQLEDRLAQAERGERVGTLAAEMAPDIAALLTTVIARGDELGRQLGTDHRLRPAADTLHEHAARAEGLVRQLVSFSHRQQRPTDPIDPHDVVSRAQPMLAHLVGPDVTLQVAAGQPAVVRVSDADLQQLLTAMVLWARERLPLGGQVHIETGHRPDDAGRGYGRRATIGVRATGYGATESPAVVPDALARLAERCGGSIAIRPDEGRGLGLELAISRCSRSARVPGR